MARYKTVYFGDISKVDTKMKYNEIMTKNQYIDLENKVSAMHSQVNVLIGDLKNIKNDCNGYANAGELSQKISKLEGVSNDFDREIKLILNEIYKKMGEMKNTNEKVFDSASDFDNSLKKNGGN